MHGARSESNYELDGPYWHRRANEISGLRRQSAPTGGSLGKFATAAQAIHCCDDTNNPQASDGADSDTMMVFFACISLRMHLDGSSILQRRPSASKVRSTVPPSS